MLRNTKLGEQRNMENLSVGLTGKKHPVKWIEFGDELGYTEKTGTIHVAYEHSQMMSGLDAKQKVAFRLGVFGHELLHQIFTDFAAHENIINAHPEAERMILATLINIIEDPAIEHQAPMVFGTELLGCLRYMIRQIYKVSGSISDAPTAFIQVVNALIYFGDIGIIKGDFTFPEAEEAFKSIVQEFYDEIHDTNSASRMRAAERWLEFLRPLWEEDKENQDELKKNLDSLMEKSGKSTPQGSGAPQMEPPSSQKDDGEADENEDGESSGKSMSPIDERRRKFLESASKGGGKENSQDNGSSEGAIVGNEEDSLAEFEISQDALDSIINKVNELGNKIRREMIDNAKSANPFDSSGKLKPFADDMKYCVGGMMEDIKAKDVLMSEQNIDTSSYNELLEINQRSIKTLTNSLKLLFSQNRDTKIHTTSGRFNVARGAAGNTIKVFDRKRVNTEADDVAVMILVDESGSMSGNGKKEAARNCCVILAESFSRLNLPCYIIGFSADNDGFQAVHHHYVTWNNTADERHTLSATSASGNNFDSYSIAYGASVLRRQRSEHKIMFVVSDGRPNCMSYVGKNDGLNKTREAIKGASKVASIVGIGIQCGDDDVFTKMYSGRFTNLSDASQLTGAITRILKRIVSSY